MSAENNQVVVTIYYLIPVPNSKYRGN